jgi:hypothetical protein
MLQADVVVLGNGPTGVFAAEFLQRQPGAGSVTLLAREPLGSLAPVRTLGGVPCEPFTLLPILPPATVFGPRNRETLKRIDSEIQAQAGPSAQTVVDGSLLQLVRNRGPFAEVLATKQYGRRRLAQRLGEVRRKIERAYKESANTTDRLGFLAGESP